MALIQAFPSGKGNGAAHTGFTPVGTIISVMGKTAPQNYLACDGAVYSINDYPELANYFTEQFDSANFFGGDGTATFAVPDLRGEFLRGTGTNSHANQGSGSAVGVHQDATIHTAVVRGQTNSGNPSGFIQINSSSPSDVFVSPTNGDSVYSRSSINTLAFESKTDGMTTGSGEYTSRPTNTSVLYCIATKNIYVDARFDYSLEEKVVGTWIDGKPVYQKTFVSIVPTTDADGADSNMDIDLAGLNIDLVCDLSAIRRSSSTIAPAIRTIPNLASSSGQAVWIYYNRSDKYMRISNHQTAINGNDLWITIQYTKTTD